MWSVFFFSEQCFWLAKILVIHAAHEIRSLSEKILKKGLDALGSSFLGMCNVDRY